MAIKRLRPLRNPDYTIRTDNLTYLGYTNRYTRIHDEIDPHKRNEPRLFTRLVSDVGDANYKRLVIIKYTPLHRTALVNGRNNWNVSICPQVRVRNGIPGSPSSGVLEPAT